SRLQQVDSSSDPASVEADHHNARGKQPGLRCFIHARQGQMLLVALELLWSQTDGGLLSAWRRAPAGSTRRSAPAGCSSNQETAYGKQAASCRVNYPIL
ncbi:MAG TPA: hypothetical protein V6D08_20505, partial [Candidatus Obscuribacterales bacterium]